MSRPPPEAIGGLVDRARAGDDQALEALIERAYPLVRRWSLVRTGHMADAEDLTQDVLVQMIRKLETFEGNAHFDSWLYSVTRNAAEDRRKRTKRRERLASEREGWFPLVPTVADDPSRDVERGELRDLVATFFEGLPERQREVFDLVDLQGVPAVEVAKRLGLEAGSVRAHLFKARRRIREALLATRPEIVEELP